MSRMSGRAPEIVPGIDESTSASDLLFIAELIRTTNFAFLSPEEREERAPFGQRPSRSPSGRMHCADVVFHKMAIDCLLSRHCEGTKVHR